MTIAMPFPRLSRRRLVMATGALAATGFAPVAFGQERRFDPQPGDWRTFDVTTQVEIKDASDATRVWLPIPSIDSPYQKSYESTWTANASSARIVSDSKYGARMLYAEFDAATKPPKLALTSRVQTRNRATDWERRVDVSEDAATLKSWTRPTDLMPTDGIVLDTAREATRGAWTDEAKVRQIYDWVVANTYREPTVKGCGVGDIKGMLETNNMGGKCADLNALFVGLCRASGIPARDLYGIRVAKSAFNYKELGAGSPDISKAQHCRAEVWLADYGWVAMDPADVAKVMRQETPEWIKDPKHEVAAPVYSALFGAWEGNWMGYNTAHDVVLVGSNGPKLGFLMYPQAETRGERLDSLDPDTFKYKITAREVTG